MDNHDIQNLIAPAITPGNQVWADLGSGEGNFTLALRELAGHEVKIFSVDANMDALNVQKKAFGEKFPDTRIQFIVADFTSELPLPKLDGILMANSLHFVKDQAQLLMHLKQYLKPSGILLVVEYNTDSPSPYVPYPLSFEIFSSLVTTSGYIDPELLGTAPSRYQGSMYSAKAHCF